MLGLISDERCCQFDWLNNSMDSLLFFNVSLYGHSIVQVDWQEVASYIYSNRINQAPVIGRSEKGQLACAISYCFILLLVCVISRVSGHVDVEGFVQSNWQSAVKTPVLCCRLLMASIKFSFTRRLASAKTRKLRPDMRQNSSRFHRVPI